MRVKGFIPLGGYSQSVSKIIYNKTPNFDFGKITGETIVVKEDLVSTGGLGSLTFINNSVKNFINSIGDSVYESDKKLSIMYSLINSIKELEAYEKNWKSDLEENSFFKTNKLGLQIDKFENFLFNDHPQNPEFNSIYYYINQEKVKELREFYSKTINDLRSLIKVRFFLKDSSNNIFGKSQEYKKINIYQKPINETLGILINDSTSSSKDGFNINEIINLSFTERVGTAQNEYSCTYNSSNFQAVVDSLYTISSITYADNKIYNEITNLVK